MKNVALMRGWLPWLGFALLGVAACQIVVGETELTTVNCRAEGAVGPPACATGKVCLNAVCVSQSYVADGGESGSSDADASSDADSVINLLHPSNGGVLESFTSEYCDPSNLPSDCEPGYWNHTNIHDGEHAYGYSPEAARASWGSVDKGKTPGPEAFEFTFKGGRSAKLERFVVQNYGEEGSGEGPYYAKSFKLWGKEEGSLSWSLLLDSPLQPNETPQGFDVVATGGGPVVVQRIKCTITAGISDDYWDLGEVEAWGHVL